MPVVTTDNELAISGLFDRLIGEVTSFTGGAGYADDLTLIVVRVLD